MGFYTTANSSAVRCGHPPGCPHTWLPEHDEVLADLSLSYAEVAKRLGRTLSSVKTRAVRLKLLRVAPVLEEKRCRTCRAMKATKLFRRAGNTQCKTCDGRASNARKTVEQKRETSRRQKLRLRIGIDWREWERLYAVLYERQGGACAICKGGPSKRRNGDLLFSMDHCHKTGKIRGLLCQPCNLGLGSFYDDPTALRAAADYLARSVADSPGPEPIKLAESFGRFDKPPVD